MSPKDSGERSGNLTEIVDALVEKTIGEKVSLADLLDVIGGRSHGALLTLPALLAVVPVISAIPGVSMTAAIIIILVSLQMLLSPRRIWIPERLLNFGFSRAGLETAVQKFRPWVRWTRHWMKPRMMHLAADARHRPIAILTAGLGVAMFILSLVPFGVTVPALAVLAFGLGLLIRDGYLIIVGLVLTAVSGMLLVLFWRVLIIVFTNTVAYIW